MAEPKLRFPEFKGEWKVLKLSDIADRVNRKNSNNETDLPLTISSLDGLVDQRTYFNKVVASKDMSGYYLLKNGEFAYNKSYSVGYDYGSIKRLDMFDMGALSTLYICFSLKDAEQSDFMVKYFDSQKWYKGVYEICAEGARNHGLLNVPVDDFLNMEVCLPKDKKEEEKILELFESIDDTISAIESEVALWEEKKKGVMQKIFSQEVRFKKEDGSDYPEWEEQEIGNLGVFIKGASLSKADISETGNPFILYGELYTTYNEVTYEIKRKTKAIVEDKYYSKMGDVVIPTSGESAEEISTATCVMREGVILAGDLYIFRSDIVDGRIMSYILNCQAKSRIAQIAQGKSIVHIQAKELSRVKIQYPTDSEEQERIAELLFTIDEVIQIKQQKLETWKNIKKGLLQQMFV
ncbi:MAG: restriction endonuclease subunit S [Butyrivibrio sp.]|nr:restriction endonuclease subunit S [Butyrivibrio sp.]